MSELKPCPVPWCAAKSIGLFQIRHLWMVQCNSCHVARVTAPTRDEAVAKWNDRPESPVIAAARAVVEARNSQFASDAERIRWNAALDALAAALDGTAPNDDADLLDYVEKEKANVIYNTLKGGYAVTWRVGQGSCGTGEGTAREAIRAAIAAEVEEKSASSGTSKGSE